jgi:choline kinase
MASRARRNIAPAKQPLPIKKDELTVIILAAKMGRRMKSRGPKSLFGLTDSLTIIDTQLQAVWGQYPNADIIVVTDFEHEKIRDYVRGRYPARIVLNPEHEQHGMMYGVGVGLQASASRKVLVMYGDLALCPGAFNLLGNASAIHITDHESNIDVEVGAVTDGASNVTNLAYGLPHKWCQMAYFTGKEFDMLEELAFSSSASTWMFHEGINNIILNGGEFISYGISQDNIIDVDSPSDLERARGLYV